VTKKGKRSKWRLGRRARWLAIAAGAALVASGLAAVFHGTGTKTVTSRQAAAVRVTLPPPPPPAPASPPRLAVAPPPIEPGPVVRPPEVPAWRKFAAVAPASDGRPLVAVVIDDLGIDRKRSARAAALPGPLTLSWLPYAVDVSRQAAAGRAAGHETLVHVPMQPQGRENPGPNALLINLPSDEIHRRLAGFLNLFPEAVGINNHMGSQFTRDARAMLPVLEELKGRGLLWLDSRTSGASIAADLARDTGVPFAARDVFLDNEQTPDYVRARLAEVEAHARRSGMAVAIGHPHDATLEVLESWLRSAPSRGLALAPISAIVKWRFEHPTVAARG
jgi:polysaccharide deacetylase 2 family uncharacterized protein YibQ